MALKYSQVWGGSLAYMAMPAEVQGTQKSLIGDILLLTYMLTGFPDQAYFDTT